MSTRTLAFRFLFTGLAALASADALASAPLSYDDARHLLNRAGFGVTASEIERYTGMSREQAARKLLDGTRTAALTPPPAWTAESGALRYPCFSRSTG